LRAYRDEGPNSLNRPDAEHSMTERDADQKAEMPEHARRVGGGTAESRGCVHQADTACEEHVGDQSSLTMEEVVCRENMLAAYQRVVSNKGAAGVDGMTVDELMPMLRERWQVIRDGLLNHTYRPAPVLKVEIPKPDGKGMRMLGIPSVLDRLIQQALLQVLQPCFDPTFSDSSFGFRPRRNAHQALEKAREHIAVGHRWVVDMDLEKFFDRVNHDVLMSRLARRIKDKRILRLIRRYLQAGMMEDGSVSQRTQGTPQGGPLTPPTMLHNRSRGAIGRWGWGHSVYHSHALFVDLDSFDQGADDLTTRHPVSFVQATLHSLRELLKPSNHQPQLLFFRLPLSVYFGLRLQLGQAILGPLDSGLELPPVHELIFVRIDQAGNPPFNAFDRSRKALGGV
jgi:hypothetical protein